MEFYVNIQDQFGNRYLVETLFTPDQEISLIFDVDVDEDEVKRVWYNNMEVDTEKTFGDYGIKNGDTILLELNSDSNINFRVNNISRNAQPQERSYKYDIEKTLESYIKHICNEFNKNYNDEVICVLHGSVVKDTNQTLLQLGIVAEDCLTIFFSRFTSFDIYCLSPLTKDITKYVSPNVAKDVRIGAIKIKGDLNDSFSILKNRFLTRLKELKGEVLLNNLYQNKLEDEREKRRKKKFLDVKYSSLKPEHLKVEIFVGASNAAKEPKDNEPISKYVGINSEDICTAPQIHFLLNDTIMDLFF